MGDRLPEVVDLRRIPSGSNVVVDFAHQSSALFVFNESLNGESSCKTSCLLLIDVSRQYGKFPPITQG